MPPGFDALLVVVCTIDSRHCYRVDCIEDNIDDIEKQASDQSINVRLKGSKILEDFLITSMLIEENQ